MPEHKQITVSKLKPGQSGKVIDIQGGAGMIARLSALGIRPGRMVTKVSSMMWRGPVTIQTGGTRLAIGHGMASRIMVEPE